MGEGRQEMTRIHVDPSACPACNGTGEDAASPDLHARCRICGGRGKLASPDDWDQILDDLESRHAPADASNEIRFYRASEKPYGCFSNLYRRPVVFEGREYPTSEHAYQAGKPRKPEVRDWLMAAPSPSLLAMAAHGLYPWDVAPGWSKGRRDRMRRVVEAKFRQHADLAEVLLSTGEARIVEAATVDNEVNRRCGEVNGVGQNWLGEILMEVRAVLAKGNCR
jgi:ribA/ribD-fused uncharacterized protein